MLVNLSVFKILKLMINANKNDNFLVLLNDRFLMIDFIVIPIEETSASYSPWAKLKTYCQFF